VHDLTIVGCGPVGAVAANLAANAGLSVVVVDRADAIFELPRAIHLDGHVMRILQQAGLADAVSEHTRIWRRSTFYGADGLPIRVHDWPLEQVQGWDAHYLFYQPTLEQVLRDGFERFEALEFRRNSEVVALRQRSEGATVVVRDTKSGVEEELESRFVLGADGASSIVRSLSGIELFDNDFDEPWLVVDVISDKEIGRADESEMFCDPRRPSTRVPGPGRHHRWEFMLLPGETAEQMQRPEVVHSLLSPWVALDEVQIVRSSVYRFHSLVAERWRDGNVFLAGDAAHQTPPFLGQGLCHGIRDSQNLIWKMRCVLDDADAEPLLSSYQTERLPQVTQIIEMSVNSGRDICILDRDLADERDRRIRREEASGKRAATTFRGLPPLVAGILSSSAAAGELFPQPVLRRSNQADARLDDVIGANVAVITLEDGVQLRDVVETYGVSLVVLDRSIECVGTLSAAAMKDWFEDRGGRFVVLRPDRYVYGVASTIEATESLLKDLIRYVRPTSDAHHSTAQSIANTALDVARSELTGN
jgi:3-(3-hydroxy-phenyl)propionate hydroxylase